jgi:Flp pilus assembly pilin Flp
MHKIGRRREKLTGSRGQTMTEYALILAGIALVALAGFDTTGNSILTGALNTVTTLISGASDTSANSSGGGASNDTGSGHHDNLSDDY